MSPTNYLLFGIVRRDLLKSLNRDDLLEAKTEMVYGFTYTCMLGLFFLLLIGA